MNVKKVHYLSGLVLAIFVGLHLFNHLCGILGAEAHIDMMNKLRLVYRNTFVEIVLMMAVVTQMVSGIRLFRINRKIATTFFERLQVWTGLYLAIFFILHLSAVFGGRYFLHLDTNFYFGVAGLNTFPFNLYFIPYYGLAIFSFFGHVASIHNKLMKKDLAGLSPSRQSQIIAGFGLVLMFVIFYSLTDHFNGVIIPKEYFVLIFR